MDNSNKMKKFETLAEKRVNNVIKNLQLIGNLANRRNYSYTDKHVNQFLQVIKKEVKDLEAKFLSNGTQSSKGFKFNIKKQS